MAAQHEPKTMPTEISLTSEPQSQASHKEPKKKNAHPERKTQTTLSQDEISKRDRALKKDFQGLMKAIVLIALILAIVYYFDQKDGALTTWSNWIFSRF